MSDRRTFLQGLVSLPLIGGGVTLIGAPSAPVPLVRAAAMPAFASPAERARYAWEAFSSAMRDVAAGADGWSVMGGERITPIPHYGLAAGGHVAPRAIHYVREPRQDPLRPFVYERADEVEL